MRRVLLTRQDNSALAAELKQRGVETLDMPLIQCDLVADAQTAADIFEELGTYDWITFSSPNAVRGFFKEFLSTFRDIRAIGIVRIACVGEATAKELRKFYLDAAVIPDVQTGVAMARAIGNYESVENLKILSVHGNMAIGDLVKALEAQRAIVDTFEVYKTSHRKLDGDDSSAVEFRKGGADVVVFSSPSAVESFVRNARHLTLEKGAVNPKIVVIGPTTAEAVKKHSMTVSAVSKSPNASDIADAVLSLLK